ncbi:Uncharacterised protein [Candidatus Ornithobacterium hominis]|uniref:Uncharacterized protein n=1 Tax=Candidatus Ornithobacterium hominis TaxID=2497989 RepID=A0A383U3H8_9FLAO|nr:hypothetical protein [Candidatus Ornithobacterium hominis]MCT7905078.1 hypothetical protein [Candidatus Ornithobacterium hominis]SZD73503.1 Uncharacterised protein [Candidatus Ornithobacterium hominis]
MNKVGKIIVFVVVSFIIVSGLAVLKAANGGGAIMWLGALAIPLIYRSLFKNNKKDNNNDNDITLKK